jgi:hypothetical protein
MLAAAADAQKIKTARIGAIRLISAPPCLSILSACECTAHCLAASEF